MNSIVLIRIALIDQGSNNHSLPFPSAQSVHRETEMSIPQHIRRKGLKDFPKLPLSVFTPPNSSAGDSFPLPPSPSALHPAKVIDANIMTKDVRYTQWKKEAGIPLAEKTTGVVIALPDAGLETAVKE